MTEPLPRAQPAVIASAKLRVLPADFQVEELPAFEAHGSGEHLLLTLRKTGLTTHALAGHVANWAGVPESAIGYAGLKDKHAVTTQRLSVWLPKRQSPDVASLATESIEVLDATWHNRKVHRGALAGNRFTLMLKDVQGEPAEVAERIAEIAKQGVPNYFGEQRFGRAGDNVAQALAMFAGKRVGRDTRSLLLSAARSELFNTVLAKRTLDGTWNSPLAGDVFMLEGSQSIFGPVEIDAGVRERADTLDIHPTGPMWGRGQLRTEAYALSIESSALDSASFTALKEGLESAGLKQERRSLRLVAKHLNASHSGNDWHLSFELPAGAYATTVMHALGDVQDSTRN